LHSELSEYAGSDSQLVVTENISPLAHNLDFLGSDRELDVGRFKSLKVCFDCIFGLDSMFVGWYDNRIDCKEIRDSI
jgi:hypothetical protein